MKKILLFAGGATVIAGAVWLAQVLYGALPAFLPPGEISRTPESKDPGAKVQDSKSSNRQRQPQREGLAPDPLSIAPGFSLSVFAEGLQGPRVMVQDEMGNIWVSEKKGGSVAVIRIQDGKVKDILRPIDGLSNPHGLAFLPDDFSVLYVAEEDALWRMEREGYRIVSREKIADFPAGGNHVTRTIGFGPDGKLYASIGSSCNVCVEEHPWRAAIVRMNPDGTEAEVYARGLRNTVFFAWDPVTGMMWGTENGRDWLGDDLPPDEINIIQEGGNYGWPFCYGKNIHDTAFDKRTYIRQPCSEPFELPSAVDLPAHVAPLGIAFVPEEGWPEEYAGDIFVALHGSWNRSVPVGYKVIRVKLNDRREVEGMEDFITGWLQGRKSLGRPVGVLAVDGGRMWISDDKGGVIYSVTYLGNGGTQ